MKVLGPSNHNYSTPLQPNHRRHTFTTAAAVCLGCGLSLNSGVKHASYIRLIWVTCTIEMFVSQGVKGMQETLSFKNELIKGPVNSEDAQPGPIPLFLETYKPGSCWHVRNVCRGALLGRQGRKLAQCTLEDMSVFRDKLRVEPSAGLTVCLGKNGLRRPQRQTLLSCDGFRNVAESLTHPWRILCFFACVERALGVDPPRLMHAASWTHTTHVVNCIMAAQEGSALVSAAPEGTGLTVSKNPVSKGVRKARNVPNGTVGGILYAPSYAVFVAKLDEVPQELVYGIGSLKLQPISVRRPRNAPRELLRSKNRRTWPYVAGSTASATWRGSKSQNHFPVLDDKLKDVPRMLFAKIQVDDLGCVSGQWAALRNPVALLHG